MTDPRRSRWATDDEMDGFEEAERLAGWISTDRTPALPFDPVAGRDSRESVTPAYPAVAQAPAAIDPAVAERPSRRVSEATPAKVGWLRQLLLGSRSRRVVEARLRRLNQAIEAHPDGAANYLLRGELFLDVGETALAEADFRAAIMLAEAQFETSRWGLVEQATRDRAQDGLSRARR